MKKIYRLKEWYSLNDAAKRLSLTLSEEVTEKEVLELALDDHIQVFWYMRHVSCQQLEFREEDLGFVIDEEGKLVSRLENPNEKGKPALIPDYWGIKGEYTVRYLQGPHRLMLEECGALSDYLRSYLTNSSGELMSIDGFMVQDQSGKIWGVRERFENSNIIGKEKWNEKRCGPFHYDNIHNFFPSGEWPEYSELGFTKTELEELENTIQGKEPKQIKNREGQTLLKMIIGMAKDGYGYDPNASRSPFPKELEGILDQLDISVSDDTIRKWLKEASELLPQEPDDG